jgi:hypothetical protein
MAGRCVIWWRPGRWLDAGRCDGPPNPSRCDGRPRRPRPWTSLQSAHGGWRMADADGRWGAEQHRQPLHRLAGGLCAATRLADLFAAPECGAGEWCVRCLLLPLVGSATPTGLGLDGRRSQASLCLGASNEGKRVGRSPAHQPAVSPPTLQSAAYRPVSALPSTARTVTRFTLRCRLSYTTTTITLPVLLACCSPGRVSAPLLAASGAPTLPILLPPPPPAATARHHRQTRRLHRLASPQMR